MVEENSLYNNECTKNMKVKVATSQFKALKGDFEANLNKAISLVEKAFSRKCWYFTFRVFQTLFLLTKI